MSLTPPAALAVIPELQPVVNALRSWLFGLDEPLEHLMIALLCGGHVLLEGPPGTAKTLMVKLLAQSVDCPFNRVQFTPDLMPADIVGTNVFNPDSRQFEFKSGPVFTTFLLADEINRAPAKTQSALLEAMQERQVTADGVQHPLSDLFTVFATQNPLEHEGTYPLPEAQLDRFLFKIILPYPSREAERQILLEHHTHSPGSTDVQLTPQITPESIRALRTQANGLTVEPSILDYLLDLVQESRKNPAIAVGISPRAGILWLKAAKTLAFCLGRDYVIPDDIKRLAKPLLRHRLILFPQAELEGRTPDNVIDELFQRVRPPR